MSSGSAIARKLRCAPRLPGPCWRDPLTEAYGRPLAGARPRPRAPPRRSGASAAAGAGGLPLLPQRELRSAREPTDGLTASNRRVTAFTSVRSTRRAGGDVEITYWLYRPGLGWEALERRAELRRRRRPRLDAAARDARTRRLVPLETLPGRNHYDFPAAEEPPWRWQVESVYP